MQFYNNRNTILNKVSPTPFLSFPSLSKIPFIKHGFSTKLGGISTDQFSTLNLGFQNGDIRENVTTNYQRICVSIGVPIHSLVLSDQIHETNIRFVTEADQGKGILKPKDYSGIDGLITNTPGVTLTTFYADCVPLYFVDQNKKAIGLSHSGWRGTVAKMGQKTLMEMTKYFGTNPKDVIALIGPSICKDCYEVSKDVADSFTKVFSLEECNVFLKRKRNLEEYKKNPFEVEEKYQLDLWKANYFILKNAGVLEENIHSSELCTCCNSELLFSHRATAGKRGTLAAFLQIL